MEIEMEVSRVKREKMRKLALLKEVQEMRENLPKYSIEEIRTHRLSFFDAAILDLKDGGFTETIEYVVQLIEHEKSSQQTNYLQTNGDELKFLVNALKTSEDCKRRNDHSKECKEFLKGAIHFAFASREWWWLGAQLLVQAIDNSVHYQTADGKYEAFSRFAYGLFKIEQLNCFDDIKIQLEIARNLSLNKVWMAKELFPDLRDPLFMQVNILMHKYYIREARMCAIDSPEEAIAIATKARKSAAAACFKEGEMEASIIKAVCEMNVKRYRAAISTLLNALSAHKLQLRPEGMCRICALLLKAHLCNGDPINAQKILDELKEWTAEPALLIYLGLAYKHFGEYYLYIGEPGQADPYLEDSLKIFLAQETPSYVSELNNLEAVTRGLKLMPFYTLLILEAGTGDSYANWFMKRLVDWKDARAPFWKDPRFRRMVQCPAVAVDEDAICEDGPLGLRLLELDIMAKILGPSEEKLLTVEITPDAIKSQEEFSTNLDRSAVSMTG